MSPLGHLLWRVVVASLGFLAAVAGSILTVVTAVVAMSWRIPDTPMLDLEARGAIGVGLVFLALAKAVWPGWLAFALLAEVAGLRSLLVHLLGFAAIALFGAVALLPTDLSVCVATADWDCGRTAVHTAIETLPGSIFRLLAAAGLVGGFGHWLVAGGSAGLRPSTGVAPGKGDARPPHA